MEDELFAGMLREHKLFAGNLWNEVQAMNTRRAKNQRFLGKAIEPPLENSDLEPLKILLKVMTDDENSNIHVKKLGNEIKQELGWIESG